MINHYNQKKVLVIGHIRPDTDSICSAIAYAWLKNQTEDAIYEPRCAGVINRESEFVLRFFNVETPRICEEVNPLLKDISFRLQPGIDMEISVLDAWNLMRDEEISTLCITDSENTLLGLISLKDMANANMDLMDTYILSSAKTPCQNIIRTLKGKLFRGDANTRITRGRICIGTSPVIMQDHIHPGDTVLVTDQLDVQKCALSCGASCLIICCGAVPSPEILSLAEEKRCILIATDYDTFQASRLICTATPVRHLMVKENLLTFHLDTPLEDVKKTMAKVRYSYFPVIDDAGKYCGVVSRRNLLNLKRKQLILVDHNEKTQAVEGLAEAEILEIIDHHRLGAPETDAPVIFRNMPVGCTSTIIYQLFVEKNIVPPRHIAGLMLSAILSDTLMFRSPTSTVFDKTAAESLAKLAEVSLPEYANMMFEAGSDLTGKSAEEIIFNDFKVFHFSDRKVGIGQVCLMTGKACAEAKAHLLPYLEKARKKADVHILFFMLTNTPDQDSVILFAGDNAADILTESFGEVVNGKTMNLPGVVSRKKQFVPPLKTALQQTICP